MCIRVNVEVNLLYIYKYCKRYILPNVHYLFLHILLLGEDDIEETGGQVTNVTQPVDGSSDAEESQRLVSKI